MDNNIDIKIKKMGMEHLDEVFEIEKNSFSSPWSKESLKKDLTENKHAVYLVALNDNKVVGYAGMWHIVNEGHITNVAVCENHRRMGIGGKIVAELINLAKGLEMAGITLEVRINNLAAQRMYTKFGFRPEGFRKNYYTDTGEDAVIMWKWFEEKRINNDK